MRQARGLGLLDKLKSRRTYTDLTKLALRHAGWFAFEDAIYNLKANKNWSADQLKIATIFRMSPYNLPRTSLKTIKAQEVVQSKLMADGLGWDTIVRSSFSEHELRNKWFGNELGFKFKGSQWHTLNSYSRGPSAEK